MTDREYIDIMERLCGWRDVRHTERRGWWGQSPSYRNRSKCPNPGNRHDAPAIMEYVANHTGQVIVLKTSGAEWRAEAVDWGIEATCNCASGAMTVLLIEMLEATP